MISQGGGQITRFALEYGTIAENMGDQPGISGGPGQTDGFADVGQRGRQIATLEPEPAQLGQGIGGNSVIGEAAGNPEGLAGHRGDR